MSAILQVTLQPDCVDNIVLTTEVIRIYKTKEKNLFSIEKLKVNWKNLKIAKSTQPIIMGVRWVSENNW